MKSIISQKQFKVIIERDETGYFIATVPALPGCHTQAKTLSELTDNVRDAVKLCISVAKIDKKYMSKIKQFSYEPSFIGIDTVSI